MRIAWIIMVCVAMLAAEVNIEKFATRPANPLSWLDANARQVAELGNKLKTDAGNGGGVTDDLRKQYMWAALQSGQRKEAHDAAALIEPLRPAAGHYDLSYIERTRHLALAELMHDCSPDMVVTMQHIYDYDRKFLPAQDIRLFRDLNNLGLACFLAGQNSQDEEVRFKMLKQSQEWLSKAQSGIPAADLTDQVSVCENQLMVAEALRDRAGADACRKRVDKLLAQINGPAPRVVLDWTPPPG